MGSLSAWQFSTPRNFSKIQLFQKFQKFSDWGHDEKLKNFGKSKKKHRFPNPQGYQDTTI